MGPFPWPGWTHEGTQVARIHVQVDFKKQSLNSLPNNNVVRDILEVELQEIAWVDYS